MYFFLPIGNYFSKYSRTSGTGSKRKIIKEHTEKERQSSKYEFENKAYFHVRMDID